jgi:hypothetical protein
MNTQLPQVTLKEIAEQTGMKYVTLLNWVTRGIIEPQGRNMKGRSCPFLFSAKQAFVLAGISSLYRTLGAIGINYVRDTMASLERNITDEQVQWWITGKKDARLEEQLASYELKRPLQQDEMSEDVEREVVELYEQLAKMRAFLKQKHAAMQKPGQHGANAAANASKDGNGSMQLYPPKQREHQEEQQQKQQ